MFRSTVLSLCFALFASMAMANPPGYNTAFYAAKERGVPLVIFVGCGGRDISGAEELELRKFPDTVGPVIVVGNTETLECRRIAPTATDSEILAAFPKRVANALPAGKYVTREGVVYREYYSTPRGTAVIQESNATTYYGSCANGQCSPQAYTVRPPQGYSIPYYSVPVASPTYSGVGIYGGFQAGPIGGYYGVGGGCANGQCAGGR